MTRKALEGRVFNRVARWSEQGLTYEADPRQDEKLIDELGLSAAEGKSPVKSLSTPAAKVTMAQVQTDKLLPWEKISHFRGLAARANYLAADRPDIQYAAKEVCRWMQSPTELGVSSLKRLARYLIDKPRLQFKYNWQSACGVEVYSDTDWAGCVRTRKSTSGGCLMIGEHLIKTWSSTQPSQTLSSGEAEMVGVTKAAAAALGFRSLLQDLGVHWPLRVWTDSFASIGMCTRQGIGKVRHMDCQVMWIQQRVRNNDIDLYKIAGEKNPADLLTKADIPRDRAELLLKLMSCEFEGGRAASAPKLRTEGGKKLFSVTTTVAQQTADRKVANAKDTGVPRGTREEKGEENGKGAEKEAKIRLHVVESRQKSTSESGECLSREGLSAELASLAKGSLKKGSLKWADTEDEEEERGRGVPDGARVSVPPAPEEAQEPEDLLVSHGEKLGAAGRGRTPLPWSSESVARDRETRLFFTPEQGSLGACDQGLHVQVTSAGVLVP